MTPREFLEILHVAERLKDTPRHCTTSRGRTESVAEHSWRISLMAMLLKGEFPEADMDKVTAMCLIHDLGECFTGDIPVFAKTEADRQTEDDLLASWVASLPAEVSSRLAALCREMDGQTTLEAKLYKSLDKLEAVIQHNESPIGTWAEHEYELNKTYAFDTVAFSPWLTELRREILSDTLQKIEREGKKAGESGLDISRFSTRYKVRRMTEEDADAILAFCLANTLYYEYCGKQPSKELIVSDLHVTPPGIEENDKYYVGFYDGDTLVAVMDLVDGYPDGQHAFIGFFMMNARIQGRGLGSLLISEVCAYLKDIGRSFAMLGIDKANPQSTHFWKKNGFAVINEVEQEGGVILVAEKPL